MIQSCKTENGRYSATIDMWGTHDANGPIFHRIENCQGYDYAPIGRSHFFCSHHQHDFPWLAIIDDFGNLVRVPR